MTSLKEKPKKHTFIGSKEILKWIYKQMQGVGREINGSPTGQNLFACIQTIIISHYHYLQFVGLQNSSKATKGENHLTWKVVCIVFHWNHLVLFSVYFKFPFLQRLVSPGEHQGLSPSCPTAQGASLQPYLFFSVGISPFSLAASLWVTDNLFRNQFLWGEKSQREKSCMYCFSIITSLEAQIIE